MNFAGAGAGRANNLNVPDVIAQMVQRHIDKISEGVSWAFQHMEYLFRSHTTSVHEYLLTTKRFRNIPCRAGIEAILDEKYHDLLHKQLQKVKEGWENNVQMHATHLTFDLPEKLMFLMTLTRSQPFQYSDDDPVGDNQAIVLDTKAGTMHREGLESTKEAVHPRVLAVEGALSEHQNVLLGQNRNKILHVADASYAGYSLPMAMSWARPNFNYLNKLATSQYQLVMGLMVIELEMRVMTNYYTPVGAELEQTWKEQELQAKVLESLNNSDYAQRIKAYQDQLKTLQKENEIKYTDLNAALTQIKEASYALGEGKRVSKSTTRYTPPAPSSPSTPITTHSSSTAHGNASSSSSSTPTSPLGTSPPPSTSSGSTASLSLGPSSSTSAPVTPAKTLNLGEVWTAVISHPEMADIANGALLSGIRRHFQLDLTTVSSARSWRRLDDGTAIVIEFNDQMEYRGLEAEAATNGDTFVVQNKQLQLELRGNTPLIN